MEYATSEELDKLKYHKGEITKIKKSQNYKNLMLASKNPATMKHLERYKLNIRRHESQIETIEHGIKIRKPRRVRNITPKYSNYPENPAKKRVLETKERSIDNKNNHTIIKTDRLEPVSKPIVIDNDYFSFTV